MNQAIQQKPAAVTAKAAIEELSFENSFVQALPGDPVLHNLPRQVRHAAYTRVDPTPVREPAILAWSDDVARALGIVRPESPTGLAAKVLGGNKVLHGMQPYAARYGGHQFGNWAGQLGDGRAITLAEAIGPDGQRYDLQLKGAGRTPYSRTADGRAVLRSSVREFMCSEAMHWLGVPSTRALSLVGTGEPVMRDMFYDGNARPEPGAIVCRVAPTFVRFGNFQILAAQQEHELLKQLADYVIRTHFPTYLGESGEPSPAAYVKWFEEICRRTARLMAHWMSVGFVHGVMNTDNMSILGLTIDYGPYGWLEGYEPSWTPNTTDAQGRRYCFGNQPQIGLWNVVQLANALIPLVEDKSQLEAVLATYGEAYSTTYRGMLSAKLGVAKLAGEEDDTLANALFENLEATETDMTIFFRQLANVPVDSANDAADDASLVEPLRAAYYDSDTAFSPAVLGPTAAWLRRYIARVRQDGTRDAARRERMNAANPKYVLRNYLAQVSIDALEEGDASVLERTLKVLERPFDEQPGNDDLAERRPEWARNRPGCSALSCSS